MVASNAADLNGLPSTLTRPFLPRASGPVAALRLNSASARADSTLQLDSES